MQAEIWIAVWLTVRLAALTTLCLCVIGAPLAWVLARSRGWWVDVVGAIVSLPLVLPPTVLGFYLLIMLGAPGPIGGLAQSLGLSAPAFTFEGLLIASIIYSLPFMVQPARNAFEAIGDGPLEAAATLRAGPFDQFWHVALPMARPGLVTGAIMTFAHTVGEFGVILMIGGNIEGETRVLSTLIYDLVENQQYGAAHWLAAGMIIFAFVVIVSASLIERNWKRGWS